MHCWVGSSRFLVGAQFSSLQVQNTHSMQGVIEDCFNHFIVLLSSWCSSSWCLLIKLVFTHHGSVTMRPCGLQVRRVHMRFPSLKPPVGRKPNEYPLGPPHDFTLLDGTCCACCLEHFLVYGSPYVFTCMLLESPAFEGNMRYCKQPFYHVC